MSYYIADDAQNSDFSVLSHFLEFSRIFKKQSPSIAISAKPRIPSTIFLLLANLRKVSLSQSQPINPTPRIKRMKDSFTAHLMVPRCSLATGKPRVTLYGGMEWKMNDFSTVHDQNLCYYQQAPNLWMIKLITFYIQT
ncbi:hypothetical protein BT69DRAFT_1298257 [Atractiella rhizophila]|nr:hypothetical protein BT69DRAFT_1298257 [Atractiella rhizophila]